MNANEQKIHCLHVKEHHGGWVFKGTQKEIKDFIDKEVTPKIQGKTPTLLVGHDPTSPNCKLCKVIIRQIPDITIKPYSFSEVVF